MGTRYVLGVVLAILCGVAIQTGLLLQKRVVNGLNPADREKRFVRSLVRNPLWLAVITMELGLGSVLFMISQGLIGPALVPGLMAAGFIVLAVGSVKLNAESLNAPEYAGIFLMIAGILLLGLSGLEISADTVRKLLELPGMAARIAFFTLILGLLWGATHLFSLRSPKRKGIIMGFSNGFPFAVSNFWISPLLAVMATVLAGDGTWGQVGLFALASAILVGTNLFGIRQTQEAFKFAQASNVIPVQQIAVQMAPIAVFFYVFSLKPPAGLSGVLLVAGAVLITLGGFLLARRQTAGDEPGAAAG